MDDKFIVSAVISVVFIIIKFIEMRFLDKESKPLKLLFRDTIIVYFSVLSGLFIIEQLNPVMENTLVPSQPSVFTDNPEF